VIDDRGVIEAVVPSNELAPDIARVDLGGATLMPGLVDCHAHFALWALDPLGHVDEPLSLLAGRTYRALADVLRAGCVGVRDPGGLDAGFRDAVMAGIHAGPRIQTSVTIVSPINGIADPWRSHGARPVLMPSMPDGACTGPVEARAKVREVIRAGADLIKVAATGGVSSRRREPTQRLFTRDELDAIVDEAHAWGRRVACHALGGDGLRMAIEAGVDSIEHGVWLDDAAIDLMLERGTWYVPTLAAYVAHVEHGSGLVRERALTIVPAHQESVARAREAGVRIACGSDGGVYGHDPARELQLLVETGLSPAEAIVSATSAAAACLGWAADMGSVAPGMRADLLVVDGDPTADIGVLADPGRVRVLQGGVAVPSDVIPLPLE
jgi:imidazolonepropionase-like amidohydrolase